MNRRRAKGIKRKEKGSRGNERRRRGGGIAGSLTAKIFLMTAGLLVLISAVTYACVVRFLPVTYQNELEEDLQKVSEELRDELARYRSLEEAEAVLELFAANNQARVTLLSEDGTIVFPLEAWETAWETGVAVDSVVLSGDAGVAVQSQYDANLPVELAAPQEVAEEGTAREEKTAADEEGISGEKEMTAENDGSENEQSTSVIVQEDRSADTAVIVQEERSAGKFYHVKIGGETYTMQVAGTMQAVSQTMRILREILPMVLGIIAVLSVLCAVAASLWLTRPIMALARISQKMAQLRLDLRCRENRADEVGVLAKSLNALAENLSGALWELRNANQQLRTDMEKEREEEQRRTSFFAAASHELKTPVTILKGHIGGMIGQVGAYQDREAYLKRSYEVTETMEGMVQEILTVSRMECGVWEARREEIDLAELVRCQSAALLELIEEKAMELSVQIPEHLIWMADAPMMEKVFRNLLVNAVRYSPEKAEIRMVMQKRGDSLLFYMENTGVHIPEASIPHLFEAFYRVEDSRNRKSGGSGLGLYIVRMIVEQHDGCCGAENSRDGVRFWLRFDA